MSARVGFEYRFHTVDEVSEYVGLAKRALEENELLPEAMDATLAACVSLLAAKHVQFEEVSPLGIVGARIAR